ncbi:MAG: hypothetical protein JNM56_34545 [Planctomycetia bacterium]|nr:hypothetical protein [Planctomycetia bacterium]
MPRSVNCPKCRSAMQVSSQTPAGKPIKCSRCGHGFSMPAADRQVKPLAKPQAVNAPPKPASRGFVKLQRALVLFVFLSFLVCGGGGGWWVYSRVQSDGWSGLLSRGTATSSTSSTSAATQTAEDTGPPINKGTGDEDPLAYVPTDSNVLVGLQAGVWMDHPVLKPLLEHGLVSLGLVLLLAECKKHTGLELNELLDTVHVAMKTPPGDVTQPDSLTFVVRSKSPFDQLKVGGWLSGGGKPTKRDGKYYYDKPKELPFARTLYFPSNRMIVFSDRPADQWADLFAADGSNPAISSEFEQALRRVEQEPVWMAQHMDEATRADVKAGKPAPLFFAPLIANELQPVLKKVLPEARGFTARITPDGDAFRLRYGIACRTDAQAQELTKAFQASWTRHKPLKGKLANNALVLQSPERKLAVQDLVDSLEFTQQAWLAEGGIKVRQSALGALLSGGLSGFQDEAHEIAVLVGNELGFPLVTEKPLILSADEKALLEMLNKFREQAAKPALKVHPKLMAVARVHAATMAKQGKAEDDLEGKECPTRVREGGYKFKVGKVDYNIASGDKMTIEQAFEHWTKTQANKDILLADFDDTGLGFAKSDETGMVYYYQVFATPEPAK